MPNEATSNQKARPPIVTVMGHVDHGKTSLLDAIRSTNVTARESGGITQHIGAYQIVHNGRKITFIDTPGHAAFSQMRARGANVTDIIILVVAADDGVMPQTKEAIAHAKASGASIIVALNKIDAEGANPAKVKDQLAKEGILVEGYGGDVPVIETSATQKIGINELLEMILLVADLLELQPDLSQPAQAVIIESHQDNRRGPVATALVQKGVLQVGDAIQANTTSGKIRTMTNDQGQMVKSATPADPVELLGLKTVPNVGSTITVYPSEREAEAQAQAIKQQVADQVSDQPTGPTDLSSLLAAPGQELKLVLKADTQGSLEAIVNSINQLESPQGTTVKFILAGTGNVSESDALLASTTNALILAFRVKIDNPAQRIITQDKLLSQSYDIIYQLLEDIEGVLAGGVPTKEVPIKGRAEVLQVFPLKSGDIVAGCRITDGLIRKGWNVKVTRGEEVVLESAPIDEIRHGADKINEAKKNSECGLMVKPTFQFEVGDIIEAL